jgi:hypothetical protein
VAPITPTGNRAADHQPAVNTAAIATIAAESNTIICGKQVHWSYDGVPTGGKLTIKSGTTVIDEVDIISGGPGFLPLDGFETVAGELLSATLAAGGATVTGKVSISGRIN